jgi:hypothetical protein
MQGEVGVAEKMTSFADVVLVAAGKENMIAKDEAGPKKAATEQEAVAKPPPEEEKGRESAEGKAEEDDDDDDDSMKIDAAQMRRATRQLLLLPLTSSGLDRLFELLPIDRHVTFASSVQAVILLQARWRGACSRQQVKEYRHLVMLLLRSLRKHRIRRCLHIVAAEGRLIRRDKCVRRIVACVLHYRGRRYARRILAMGARVIEYQKVRKEMPWAFADEDAAESDIDAGDDDAAARAMKLKRRKDRLQARRRWRKRVLFRLAFQIYVPDADHGRELSRAAAGTAMGPAYAQGARSAAAGAAGRSRRSIGAAAGVELFRGQAGIKRHVLSIMPPLPESLRASWEREERVHKRGYGVVQTNVLMALEDFIALSEEEQKAQAQREKDTLLAKWRTNDAELEKRRRRNRARRYEGESNIGSVDGHAADFRAGRKRRAEMSSKAYLTVIVYDPTTSVLVYYSISKDQLEEILRGTGACTTERDEERLAPHALASLSQCFLYRERTANDRELGMPKFKLVLRSTPPTSSLASRLGPGRAMLLYRRHTRFSTDETSYLISIYISTQTGAGPEEAARRRNSVAGDGGGDTLHVSCYNPLTCTEHTRSLTLTDVEASLTLTEADDSQFVDSNVGIRDGALVVAERSQNNREFIDQQLGGQGDDIFDGDDGDEEGEAEHDQEHEKGWKNGNARITHDRKRPAIVYPKRSGDNPYPVPAPPDPLTEKLETAKLEAIATAAYHATHAARAVFKMNFSVRGNQIGAMSPLEQRRARAAAKANYEPMPDYLDASISLLVPGAAEDGAGDGGGTGGGNGGGTVSTLVRAGTSAVAIKCQVCGDITPAISIGKHVIRSMHTSHRLLAQVRKRMNEEAQERRSAAVLAAVEQAADAEDRATTRFGDKGSEDDEENGAQKRKQEQKRAAKAWPWMAARNVPRRTELKWLRHWEAQQRMEVRKEEQRMAKAKLEEWAQAQKDTAPLTDAQREVIRIEEQQELRRMYSLKKKKHRALERAEQAEMQRKSGLQQWQLELEARAAEEKKKIGTRGAKEGMAALPQWCAVCYKERAKHRDYFDFVSGRGREDSMYAQALRRRQSCREREAAAAGLIAADASLVEFTMDGQATLEDGQATPEPAGVMGAKEKTPAVKRRTVKWAHNQEFEYAKGSEPTQMLALLDEKEQQGREEQTRPEQEQVEQETKKLKDEQHFQEQQRREAEREAEREPSLLEIVRNLRYSKLTKPAQKWPTLKTNDEESGNDVVGVSKRPLYQQLASASQRRLLRWLAGSLFICRERELLAIGGHGSEVRKVYDAGCTCRVVGCGGQCICGLALVQELVAGRHRAGEVMQRWWRCLRARLQTRARAIQKMILVKWNPPSLVEAAIGVNNAAVEGVSELRDNGSVANETGSDCGDSRSSNGSNNGKSRVSSTDDEPSTDAEPTCLYYCLNLRTQSCFESKTALGHWELVRARTIQSSDAGDGAADIAIQNETKDREKKHYHFRNSLKQQVQWEQNPFPFMVRCGVVRKLLTTDRWIKLRAPLDLVDASSIGAYASGQDVSGQGSVHVSRAGSNDQRISFRRGAALETRAAAVAAVIVDGKAQWEEQWQKEVQVEVQATAARVLARRLDRSLHHAEHEPQSADRAAKATPRSQGGGVR